MTLATVGSVVGIVSGGIGIANALGGGGGSSSGQQAAGMADPFGPNRAFYGNQLNQYMTDPTKFIQQSPGYQFNYQQGLDSLRRQFAAGGMSASGNALLGAEQYGQNYAMNTGNNIFNQLAQLSGANWNSGPNAAGAMLAQQRQQYGMAQDAGQGFQGALGAFGDSPGGQWLSGLFNSPTPDTTGSGLSPSSVAYSSPSYDFGSGSFLGNYLGGGA